MGPIRVRLLPAVGQEDREKTAIPRASFLLQMPPAWKPRLKKMYSLDHVFQHNPTQSPVFFVPLLREKGVEGCIAECLRYLLGHAGAKMADLVSVSIILESKQLCSFFLAAHLPGESLQTLHCSSLHTVIDACFYCLLKSQANVKKGLLGLSCIFSQVIPTQLIIMRETFRDRPDLLSNFSTTYMQILLSRMSFLRSG